MYVAASLLNPAATRQTQEMWRWLEENCGLAGIKLTPLPHFSWHGASEYDLPMAEKVFQSLAKSMHPFTTRVSGLGIFPGEHPVIYLTLVKTRLMIDLHEKIWHTLSPWGVRQNEYYEPDYWVPHITLAYRDVTPDNLPCALQQLSFHPISLEIQVDHLAMIYEAEGEIGIKFRYDFAE